MTATPKLWTVHELNQELKRLIDRSMLPIVLIGEISNLRIQSNGTVYLSLKDEYSQIFRSVF